MSDGKPRYWSFDRDNFAFDFAPFSPDRRALLDLVRAEIDDAILHEISLADYGDRPEEYFAALDAIRSTGDVPHDLDCMPGEVLQLAAYDQPDDPAFMPQSTHGEGGHRKRLFCMVTLLRNGGEGGAYWSGSENDALSAFESSLRLGQPYVDAAVAFFAWFGEQFEQGDSGRAMAALAIAALWPYSSFVRRTQSEMKRLAERLYGPPAPSGLDWFVHACFHRPRWESLLNSAANEARTLADARVISRKCAIRFSRLAERVRTVEDPFSRSRERHVRFDRDREWDHEA